MKSDILLTNIYQYLPTAIMRRNPGEAQMQTKTGVRGQSPCLLLFKHSPLGSSPALNTRPLGLVPGGFGHPEVVHLGSPEIRPWGWVVGALGVDGGGSASTPSKCLKASEKSAFRPPQGCASGSLWANISHYW